MRSNPCRSLSLSYPRFAAGISPRPAPTPPPSHLQRAPPLLRRPKLDLGSIRRSLAAQRTEPPANGVGRPLRTPGAADRVGYGPQIKFGATDLGAPTSVQHSARLPRRSAAMTALGRGGEALHPARIVIPSLLRNSTRDLPMPALRSPSRNSTPRPNLNKSDQNRPDPTTQNHPDQIGSSPRPAPNTPNRAEQT